MESLKYFFVLFLIVLIILIELYDKRWKPRKHEKMINEYINKSGGVVYAIERFGDSGNLYIVDYSLDNKRVGSVVKFTSRGSMEWN